MVTAPRSPERAASSRPRSLGLLLVGLVAAMAAGCEPTCKATCKKLLSCDEVDTPRVSLSACQEECEEQQTLYDEQWTDIELRERFKDYKQCVEDESCADIADGVCYDEELYLF